MFAELKVTIRGISPLLMNAFHPQDTSGTVKPTGAAVMGNPAEWREKAHLNQQGQVCWPAAGMMRCWSNAGANIKSGRNKETYKRIIPSGIIIHHEQSDWIPFLVDGSPFTLDDIEAYTADKREASLPTVDSRPVRQGGSGIMRYRIKIPRGWSMFFDVTILLSEIQPKGLLESLIIGGERYGLGDFRPSSPRPGSYGVFEVIQFGDFHRDDIEKAKTSSAPAPASKKAAKKEEVAG